MIFQAIAIGLAIWVVLKLRDRFSAKSSKPERSSLPEKPGNPQLSIQVQIFVADSDELREQIGSLLNDHSGKNR